MVTDALGHMLYGYGTIHYLPKNMNCSKVMTIRIDGTHYFKESKI